MDAIESAHKQVAQSSTRSRNSAVNMQNIQEFVKLQHRGSGALISHEKTLGQFLSRP